ncbi:MerR family transcriptional regulator, partial [Acinetobacter baumannii]
MNLAKVSELTKVSPRMLRYYENLGLIQPHRASNNYRSYTPVSYTHLTLP